MTKILSLNANTWSLMEHKISTCKFDRVSFGRKEYRNICKYYIM